VWTRKKQIEEYKNKYTSLVNPYSPNPGRRHCQSVESKYKLFGAFRLWGRALGPKKLVVRTYLNPYADDRDKSPEKVSSPLSRSQSPWNHFITRLYFIIYVCRILCNNKILQTDINGRAGRTSSRIIYYIHCAYLHMYNIIFILL